MSIWRKSKVNDTLSMSGNIMNSYTNAGLSSAECLDDTSNVVARYNANKGLAIGGIAVGIGGILYGTLKSIAAENQLRRDTEALQAKIDYASAMKARLDASTQEEDAGD